MSLMRLHLWILTTMHPTIIPICLTTIVTIITLISSIAPPLLIVMRGVPHHPARIRRLLAPHTQNETMIRDETTCQCTIIIILLRVRFMTQHHTVMIIATIISILRAIDALHNIIRHTIHEWTIDPLQQVTVIPAS